MFYVEEASWTLEAQTSSDTAWEIYFTKLESWLDRLDVARERSEPYQASRALLEQDVVPGLKLYDLLWNGQLPRDLQERITAHFGMLTYWDDQQDYSALDATIDGHTVFSPSAARVSVLTRAGQLAACLPLPGRWEGWATVGVNGMSGPVCFVVDESTHRAVFRRHLSEHGMSERDLVRQAPHAFPSLCFHPKVWDGLRHFEGGYPRVREALLRFLAVLDDEGGWIFSDRSGALHRAEQRARDMPDTPITRLLIERRFGAVGLDVSPEHAEVAANGATRRARERVFRGRTLFCEWHYKIEPQINRVHLHAPVEETGHKVAVAIFHSHLPLP